MRCRGLLGDYTLLAKTFEGELEESLAHASFTRRTTPASRESTEGFAS
jgi:hypothetical protein